MTVSGADLAAALARLPAALAAAGDAPTRAGAIIADQVTHYAPRRTGRLVRSVTVTIDGGGGTVAVTVPYGRVIHDGWRKHGIDPNPFLDRAAEAATPRVADEYAAAAHDILRSLPG